MKLAQLKRQVYNCWENLSTFNGAIAQPDNFKAEVRAFGDLRRQSTWESAYCSFWAKNLGDCWGCPAYEFIITFFNFQPEQWNYYLRHQIFDEFLAIPGSIEVIKTGLEQLFSEDFTPQEREEVNVFFRWVEEQSARRGIDGDTTRFIRQLAEFTRTAAG
jgi:hypothetical protein